MIPESAFFGGGTELVTAVTAQIHPGYRVWNVDATAGGVSIVMPAVSHLGLRLGDDFLIVNNGTNSFNLLDFESFFFVADGAFFLGAGAALAVGKVARASLISFGGTPGWNMTRWDLSTSEP